MGANEQMDSGGRDSLRIWEELDQGRHEGQVMVLGGKDKWEVTVVFRPGSLHGSPQYSGVTLMTRVGMRVEKKACDPNTQVFHE